MDPQKPSDEQLMKLAQQSLTKLKQVQKDAKWQLFSEQPCKMYKMQRDNRVMSKGQCTVNIALPQLFQKLSYEKSLLAINNQLKQIQVLYKFQVNGKEARVNYMRYAGIWPVEDRDLVNVGIKQSGQDLCYIATQACDYPHPKVNKVTRAICHIGGYVLKKIDDKSTHVTYISDVDLAGSIPGMIKNQLSQKQASLPSRIEKALKDYKIQTK